MKRLTTVRVLAAMGALVATTSAPACGSHGRGGIGDGPNDGGVPSVGATITQVTGVTTKLPTLPTLTNVVGIEREDSVGIDFDPFDGATDYRVYPLPADGDIAVDSTGAVRVKNAIYRCAGKRQTFALQNNTSDGGIVTAGQYAFTATVPSTPTLGYVYVTPGPGLAPVYVAAGYSRENEEGWRESRLKVYTTDEGEQQMLVSQGWSDDGIEFYVPATADSTTQTIYSSQNADIVAGQGWMQYSQSYFGAAYMAAHASDSTPPAPAFQVLSAPGTGTEPLMAVLYEASDAHVELAAGPERFARAANQGNGPLWHVEWTGITQPTMLVVEALASGCPFQGFLSPEHLAAPPHQTFYTVADLQAMSPTGEAFLNGQYDTTTFPVAVARSFVQVTPQPHGPTAWDWYQGFAVGTEFGGSGPMPATLTNCFQCFHDVTSIFDITAYNIDEPSGVPVLVYGQFLGQMWDAFDDNAHDVTGKLRFTALQKASVVPGSYLHATMSTDIVSTDRRYPQLIISDQDAPVQDGLSNPDNNTMLIQTRLGPAMSFEIQAFHGLVNGKPWDVNNQATPHPFTTPDYSISDSSPVPTDPTFEHAGMDRLARLDVYVSPDRVYAFLDGAPVGCTQLPGGFAMNGAVTVTFGDVLYHEGAVDELICSQSEPYSFMHEHQCTETRRHFDDLGFKSGIVGPTWDTTRLPCVPY